MVLVWGLGNIDGWFGDPPLKECASNRFGPVPLLFPSISFMNWGLSCKFKEEPLFSSFGREREGGGQESCMKRGRLPFVNGDDRKQSDP
mmetsp:Transcript_38169/g.74972  ORF Transcript_38169/g.74972 Transcript_38169/m.74972 type:complete len:89 (-) Transcript_38169:32-298(-)